MLKAYYILSKKVVVWLSHGRNMEAAGCHSCSESIYAHAASLTGSGLMAASGKGLIER